MVDIRLISILPPPNVQQSGSISQGSSTNLPPILINFPPGSILSGFIINRDSAGNPILRTPDSGDITFQTNFFLKIGSEVVIRVENKAGSNIAHILTVDGLPPEVATQSPRQPLQDDVIVGRAATNTTPDISSATQQPLSSRPQVTVQGTLLPHPEPDSNQQPVPQQLTLRIVSLTAPAGTATTPVTPSNALPPPAYYAAYTKISDAGDTGTLAPSVTQSVASQPQTASPLSQSPAIPSQAPTPVNTATAQLQTLVAQVIGREPSGETLLQTPLGVIRLQPETALPKGSTVTLQLISSSPLNPSLPPTDALPPADLTELAQGWNSIRQIAALLSALPGNTSLPWLPVLNPQQSASPAPVAPQNVSTGLMFFISALRGGDFTNWLGEDNIRWLKQNGHEPLLQKATSEFATMSRSFTEATQQPGQWQSVFFPIAVNGQMEQVRFFVKRDRRKQKRDIGKDEQDTRFVVEMSLSQMGQMQFDGFVRRNPKQTDFDLYIRSHLPFPEDMQREIAQIYNHIGQLTGYSGNLVFQAVREFPVNPMNDILSDTSGSVLA